MKAPRGLSARQARAGKLWVKARPAAPARLREDVLHQRIPLGLHIAKCRCDENTDEVLSASGVRWISHPGEPPVPAVRTDSYFLRGIAQ